MEEIRVTVTGSRLLIGESPQLVSEAYHARAGRDGNHCAGGQRKDRIEPQGSGSEKINAF